MILGYVDAQDRVYDMGFATLKLKMRIESEGGTERVLFSQPTGAGEVAYRVLGETDATASMAMDHDGSQVPLLRPVEGHLYRHEGGLLFTAEPRSRDPADPGFYLVKTQAMLGAVRFFFEEQGGREMLSVPQDEILRVRREKDRATVYVSAASIALPTEKIAYALEFAPGARVGKLVNGLGMSPPP